MKPIEIEEKQTTIYRAKYNGKSRWFQSRKAAEDWVIKKRMWETFQDVLEARGNFISVDTGRMDDPDHEENIFWTWRDVKPGFFADARKNGLDHAVECLRRWAMQEDSADVTGSFVDYDVVKP